VILIAIATGLIISLTVYFSIVQIKKFLLLGHDGIIAKHPKIYLYLACLIGYLISWVGPEESGIVDYLFAFLVSFGIYAAATNVHIKHEQLKIVMAVMTIEFMAMIITFMAGYYGFIVNADVYARYGYFWFDNYPAMLGTLNAIELIILMAGVPWGDIFDRMSNRAYQLWHNRHYGINYRKNFDSNGIKIQEQKR